MICLIRGKDNHSTSKRTTYRNRRQWLPVRQRHSFGFTQPRSGYMHVEYLIVHVKHCHQGRICVILFDVTSDQVCSQDGVPRHNVARQRLIVQSQSVLLGAERRHTQRERERERERGRERERERERERQRDRETEREREREIITSHEGVQVGRHVPPHSACACQSVMHMRKENTTMRLHLHLEMQRI